MARSCRLILTVTFKNGDSANSQYFLRKKVQAWTISLRSVGNDKRATVISGMESRHKNGDVLGEKKKRSNLDVWRLRSLVFKTASFTHSEHIEEISIKSKCDHFILNSDLLCPSLQRSSSHFLKQITAKTRSYSVILGGEGGQFLSPSLSLLLWVWNCSRYYRPHTLYCWKCMKKRKSSVLWRKPLGPRMSVLGERLLYL